MHTTGGFAFAAATDALAREGQSQHVAAQLAQLASEAGLEAGRVHRDPSLSVDQKRAALQGIQRSSQERLDALIAPPVQAKLPAAATEWLKILGDGKYKPYVPSLVSTGGTVFPTESVDAAPRAPTLSIPVPRRP